MLAIYAQTSVQALRWSRRKGLSLSVHPSDLAVTQEGSWVYLGDPFEPSGVHDNVGAAWLMPIHAWKVATEALHGYVADLERVIRLELTADDVLALGLAEGMAKAEVQSEFGQRARDQLHQVLRELHLA